MIAKLIWEALCHLEPVKNDRFVSPAIASLMKALDLADALNKPANKCQHEGCQSIETTACGLPDNKGKEYYCFNHASQHGYCFGCGEIWAGVTSFEFPLPGAIAGYCENCSDAIASEFESCEDDW